MIIRNNVIPPSWYIEYALLMENMGIQIRMGKQVECLLWVDGFHCR